LFKSLLFLATGAVQHAAGSRDLNQLGSLFKKMPVTGGAFLIGACAIAGLPPLNGFVSELMIYMAVLLGVADPVRSGAVPWALLIVLVIGSLALIGGLATACFTKAFGCVFLGEARSDAAERAEEVEPAMRVVMFVLAGACLTVALSAPVFLAVLQPAITAAIPTSFRDTMTSAADAAERPLIAVCLVFWILLSALGLLAWGRRRLLARAQVDRGPTWACGYAAPTARMQYTGSSYVNPLMTLFRLFLQPEVRLHKPEGLFPRSASYASQTLEVVSEYCYRPVLAGAAWIAMKLRFFQHGRIQFYVLYIALTVLILLLWKLGD
jgi:NADH:ubiquinone oxidoreductase subunit 5 (subunit L)/multisubunit Na+/H+ antiporter MnhA subunit